MTKGSLILYSCLLFLLDTGSADANEQPLPEQAKAFVYQQLSHQITAGSELVIEVRQTNARLKLNACAKPVEFSSSRPLHTGSNTLKASCDYPRRWSQYIRVEVSLLQQVVVSRRPLSKGESLTTNDLRFEKIDQAELRNGFFNTPEQILGHVLNRSIAANRLITPKMLTSPILIHQGDSTTIRAGNNGITVEMSGTALESGRLGQQIRIENNRSGKTVKARIIGKGVAKALR